jgi:hypothetical protein
LLWLLGVGLLAADLAFLVGHVGVKMSWWGEGWKWYLHVDGGYPELFQYLKAFWLAVGCVALAGRGQRWLIGWAVLFGMILIDDLAQVHERLGLLWGGEGRWLGLRRQDVGELLALGLIGGVAVIGPLLATWLGGPRVRGFARAMLAPLGLLIFSGVVVDFIHEHQWIAARPALHAGMVLLEDFGEHLALTWAVLAAAAWSIRR